MFWKNQISELLKTVIAKLGSDQHHRTMPPPQKKYATGYEKMLNNKKCDNNDLDYIPCKYMKRASVGGNKTTRFVPLTIIRKLSITYIT